MPEPPDLRICSPKSVTYHWPVIHFQPLTVHRPVYSNCIDELKVVCRCASGISFILKDVFCFLSLLLQRFSEGGIQIHKNLYSQDFHELHSDSAALPFFPHFQLVFIASFLLSPSCPPPWLVGLCPTFSSQAAGVPSHVAPQLKTALHFPLFSLVASLRGSSGGLPRAWQAPSFFACQYLYLFFSLCIFKDFIFSEVTSFLPYPSQNQSGADETKIHSQPTCQSLSSKCFPCSV